MKVKRGIVSVNPFSSLKTIKSSKVYFKTRFILLSVDTEHGRSFLVHNFLDNFFFLF